MFSAYAGSSASSSTPLNMNRSFSLPLSLADRVSRLKVFSGNAGRDEVRTSSNSTPTGSPFVQPPLLPLLPIVPEGQAESSPEVHDADDSASAIPSANATAANSPESRTPSLAGSDDEGQDEAGSDTSVDSPVSPVGGGSGSGSKWGFGKKLNPFRSRKRPTTAPSPIVRSRSGSGDAASPAITGMGLGLDTGTAEREEEGRGRAKARAISIQEPTQSHKDKERGKEKDSKDNKEKDKKIKRTRSKSNSLTSSLTNSPSTFPPLLATTSRDSTRTRGSIGTNASADSPVMTASPSDLDQQASSLILGAMSGAGAGAAPVAPSGKDKKGAAVSGAMGMLGLKAAAAVAGTGSLTSPNAEARGRVLPSQPVGSSKASTSREDRAEKQRRAPSPFFRARTKREEARKRDTSPEIGALAKEKDESDGESVVSARRKYRPQASAYEETDGEHDDDDDRDDSDSDDDNVKYSPEAHLEGEDFGDEWDDEIEFDDETLRNTEANAVFYEGDAAGLGGTSVYGEERLDNYGEEIEQDILGEGPNVIVPPAPLFSGSVYQPAKKETLKSGLELETSRPVFARDRCTIVLTHGEPDRALEESGKRLRRYVVLSDLSEESRYAVEWAVGTVARDGDEVFLISVKEEESKVDPKQWSNSDRAQKLRVQKERQTGCLLLTRQVTGLLQRTHLNITITCQFLHAKNSRHMLLDLIDFLEPTMVIVGSRGLGKLKGILLGSTSHYLVQKSSVPIMVARRRLQRPLRKTNPANLRHAPRVGLAGASIEKTASSKQEDDVVDVAEQERAEMQEEKDREREKGGAGAKRGSI